MKYVRNVFEIIIKSLIILSIDEVAATPHCILVCCSFHFPLSNHTISSSWASRLTCSGSGSVHHFFICISLIQHHVFLSAYHCLRPAALLLVNPFLISQQANEVLLREHTYVGAHLLHHHFIILALFCSLSHHFLISSDESQTQRSIF